VIRAGQPACEQVVEHRRHLPGGRAHEREEAGFQLRAGAEAGEAPPEVRQAAFPVPHVVEPHGQEPRLGQCY